MRFAVLAAVLIGGALLVARTAEAATPDANQCFGDCNGDRVVRIDELILAVNIALGRIPPSACPYPDCPGDLFISCALKAVLNALSGCPGPTPTPSPIGAVEYRLTEGSSILVVAANVSTGAGLTGTFTVVPSGPVEGNSVFHFSIIDIAWQSPALHLAIAGDNGAIDATDLVPEGRVAMHATASIDGQAVELSGDEPLSVLLDYPPTIRYLQICGAPGSTLTCDAVSSAGSGYEVFIVAQPEASQTPVPTPTPTPTFPIRYRLVEGSTIAFRPLTPGAALFVPEPLSGSFTVVRCQSFMPNTLFLFTIETMDLASASYSVTGAEPQPVACSEAMGIGYLEASTLYPGVYMFARVSINGETIGFNGSGEFGRGGERPTVQNLEACGVAEDRSVDCRAIHDGTDGGYDVTLFAVPDN
jgi:hypothetical protein